MCTGVLIKKGKSGERGGDGERYAAGGLRGGVSGCDHIVRASEVRETRQVKPDRACRCADCMNVGLSMQLLPLNRSSYLYLTKLHLESQFIKKAIKMGFLYYLLINTMTNNDPNDGVSQPVCQPVTEINSVNCCRTFAQGPY